VNTRTGQYDIKGGGGMTINNTPANQMSDVFAGLIKDGMESDVEISSNARQTLPTINTMIDLLDSGVSTGMGAEQLLNVQKTLQTLGVDVNAEDIAEGEMFVGLSNKLILPEVKLLGQNPTDKDLAFIVKGTPELSKSAEGNRLMLRALQISKQRAIALQDHMQQWLETEGANLQGSPIAFYNSQLKARKSFNNEPFSKLIGSLRSSVNAKVKSNQGVKSGSPKVEVGTRQRNKNTGEERIMGRGGWEVYSGE